MVTQKQSKGINKKSRSGLKNECGGIVQTQMATLTFNGENFIFHCSYDERLHAQQSRFRWDRQIKKWYTPFHSIAARLRKFADESAQKEMDRVLLTTTPWTGRIPYPKDQTPYGFQIPAAKFALERNRSYLGLDPRLGKTIVAALIINATEADAIYICPPFLTASVIEKLNRWLVKGAASELHYPMAKERPRILLVPDSQLLKLNTIEAIRSFVTIAKRGGYPIRLFVDEAHRFKTPTAKRTKALYQQIVPLFDRITFMSGSPMPNSPIELYEVLSRCAPETIDHMNFFDYGRRYCDAYQHEHGWDFSGASNVEELSENIKPFMLRLRKSDVLKDLPPLVEEMIVIDEEVPPTAAPLDKLLLESFSPKGYSLEDGHIATYRRIIGEGKVTHAIEHIESVLEDTKEKILIFGIHKKVMSDLFSGLKKYNPLMITGETLVKDRQSIVEEFQNNDNRRIFLGNIQAAGIGFDLWKAERVIFVEFDWVPGNNDQACERAFKIGKSENIFVQYLVYKNSVDRSILDANFKKRKSQKFI